MSTIAATLTPNRAMTPHIDHLRALEAESIHIMREVVAEFERPVMLYSIGKDSSVLLRLAQKAFHPGPIPAPSIRRLLVIRQQQTRRSKPGMTSRAFLFLDGIRSVRL